MKLRVVPSALSLILGGGIPGLIAVTPARPAAAKSACSTQSAAYAINDNGQVTGWAHTASEATHVFMWSNGAITDLGTFGLDPVGGAINNHGLIVGQSSHGAWIWSGGVFQDLNNLIPPGSGFTLDNATAINDNGQIVASGSNAQGQEHALLLTELVSAPRIYRPPA